MESVGQGGDVRDVRSPADIAAPLMGYAVEQEGQYIRQQTVPRLLPQPKEPPVKPQMVAQGVVHEPFP